MIHQWMTISRSISSLTCNYFPYRFSLQIFLTWSCSLQFHWICVTVNCFVGHLNASSALVSVGSLWFVIYHTTWYVTLMLHSSSQLCLGWQLESCLPLCLRVTLKTLSLCAHHSVSVSLLPSVHMHVSYWLACMGLLWHWGTGGTTHSSCWLTCAVCIKQAHIVIWTDI